MTDKTIQGNQMRPSEPPKEPKKTTSEKVIKRAHEVYFLGVREIQRAHSAPPSTARLGEHTYSVATSGQGTPKK